LTLPSIAATCTCFATTANIAKTSVRTRLDHPDVMDTDKAAAAAMPDSDSASECSHFSIITPPSPPAASSCSKCSSQEEVHDMDSEVTPVVDVNEGAKDKRRLRTKSKKSQAEAPKPCIHSLNEKSEYLSTRLSDVELRLGWYQMEAAAKSANEYNSTIKDTSQEACSILGVEIRKDTLAALLKDQYHHRWNEVACLLRQVIDEHEIFYPPGMRQNLSFEDQQWCLEVVKKAFIASVVDDVKRDASATLLATSTLAPGGIPGLPPSDKTKKRKGYKEWQPEPYPDPFSRPQPEATGMPPTDQYPGYPDPFAQRQPMPYPPPPPNPEAYGMPPTRQYPDPSDPFAHMYARPYTPPPPPPPLPNPGVHVTEDFPRPHDPFAGVPPLPYRPWRSIDSRSSSSVGWRQQPKLKSRFKPRLRINKIEVRWWLQTVFSAFKILCMIVVILTVFRTPGLLGELVDVMNPKNRDRCLGFKVRR